VADLSASELTAVALLVCLVPAGIVCARAGVIDRLVALELVGTLVALVLVLLADAYARPSFMDVALTLALLTFPGVMAFAQTLERWL
jgi:multicomponent Na+:H+ antiporter subunit F